MRPTISEIDLSAFADLAHDLSAQAIKATESLARRLRPDLLENGDLLRQYAACALELATAATREQCRCGAAREDSPEQSLFIDGYITQRWKSGEVPDYGYPCTKA